MLQLKYPGRHLLQHLLKAVVSSPGAAFDTAVTSRHVELLHSLCLPTHKLSQERFAPDTHARPCLTTLCPDTDCLLL